MHCQVNMLMLCGLFIMRAASEAERYYVKSSTSHLCPGSPCETLDYYASNANKYFTDNTSFLFLPGTHLLNKSVNIENVSHLIFLLLPIVETKVVNATIKCNGPGGLVFQNANNIRLEKLAFKYCGQILPNSLQRDNEAAQAALAFGEVTGLLLESVSVTHSRGYGILGHCIHGDFIINNSSFSFNNGSAQYLGGNAAIEYTNCSQHAYGIQTTLHVSYSNFTHGNYEGYNYTNYTYDGTLATGLILILSQTNINVLITDVNMEANHNNIVTQGFGGNLFIHFLNKTNHTSNSVIIRNSKFIHGSSWTGGGISVSFYTNSNSSKEQDCKNSLTIHKSNISYNRGIIGSGLYIDFQLENTTISCPCIALNVSKCTFESNALQILHGNIVKFVYLGNGVAVHMIYTYPYNKLVQQTSQHFEASYDNCNFKNSHVLSGGKSAYAKENLALGMTFVVSNARQVKISNCKFESNNFTAIGAYRTEILLSGEIMITNNSGINGGGLMLCESSYIILSKYTNISFVNNSAILSGGGIFVERECLGSTPFCFYQFNSQNQWNCKDLSKTVNIFMLDNMAGYAGDHIYGGSLDNCNLNDCNSTESLYSLFGITPNLTKCPSAIASYPRKICFCIGKKLDCNKKTLSYPQAVYPGEKIDFALVTVGQFDGTVPGTVLSHSQNTNIEPSVHLTRKFCTDLKITITTNQTHYSIIELQMPTISSSKIYTGVSETLHVNVSLRPCPPGFQHNYNICDCDTKLMAYDINCNITNHTIIRTPPAWIGYQNETDGVLLKGIIYHEVCPYDYCLDQLINIATDDDTFDQDSQCAPNRMGILCSKCKNGFSLSAGTSDCIKCKSRVPEALTIIGFILVGIIFVLFLVLFDITTTEGTFSALLFYGNIVNINDNIFLPSRDRNVLTMLISWMNFNHGFKACFYDGMDSYMKVWLSFCLPLYLFFIVAVIIFLCRKSERVTRVFGGNIIKVLATLVQLSYTKLLQSVVTVLSFTVIEYSSNNSKSVHKIVWLFDPSLEYFSGKHIPLALVAILFGLLILAYTLVLLFVQPLQRYSHLRCFSWMAKIKPLIDAYTAPHIIKDHCRCWEGLLLLFRLILVAAFAGNVNSKIETNLTVIILFSVLLLSIAWSMGGVYKKTYLNILNTSSILNLSVLCIVFGYISEENAIYKHRKSVNHSLFQTVVYTSFAVAIATLLVILAIQVYNKIKSWYMKCKRQKYLPLDTSNSMPALRQFPGQE